ncbi:MAG: hypothetical protein AAGE96_01445 [Cyanobacteria bacterium P01_G01_bin.19]
MNSQIGFIVKVLLLSTVLSVLIKYGGRYIPIQPTNAIAIALVFLPSLILGSILGWQYLTDGEN